MLSEFQKDEIATMGYNELSILRNSQTRQAKYTILKAIDKILNPMIKDIESEIEYVKPDDLCFICKKGFFKKFSTTHICHNCYDV